MDDLFYWGNLILSYGVTGYVLFKVLFSLFRPKYERKIYFIAYTFFIVFSIVVNQQNIPLLKSFYGIIITYIICALLFSDPINRKVVAVGLFFFLYIMMADVLSVLFFTLCTHHTIEATMKNNFYLFICGLMNQVLLLCLYGPILDIINKHKFDSITKQQNIFLIILAIFEITLLNYISIVADNTVNSVVLAFLSSGFLALDIYLIYLFEVISQKYKLEKEMELRDQQISMQNNYFHSIEAQYDHSRRLIHDMKNHMQTLEELYFSGSSKEAKKYAQIIVEKMDNMSGRFKCKNRILTIIVNDKILKCDEYKIVFNIRIENLNFDFIDPFDITTIFSNLLDNAVEACVNLNSDDRSIELQVYSFNKFLIISVCNKYTDNLLWESGKLRSTKDGQHKGLGIKNVESVVKKYNGTMNIKDNNNFFEVKILLSMVIVE